jgi:hypothetical protein
MNHYDNWDRLTGEEESRFAALPREVPIRRHEEETTIAALRSEELLPPRTPRRAVALGRNRVSSGIIGLAAATAIFLAGFVFGKQAERRSALDISPIGEVQRAGTAYVAALVRLAESGSSDSANTVANGLEVGTSTLRAAAVSAVRITPDDPALTRIRDGLELATNFTSGTRKLVWY